MAGLLLMIDTSKISIDVISIDGTMGPVLRAWLDRNVELYHVHMGGKGIALAHNTSIEHFLSVDVPAGKEFLVQLDNDINPVASTINLFTGSDDLVYCGKRGPDGSGHYGDGDFDCGCARMSADLLREMEPPWYFEPLSDDGTRPLMCACKYFRQKAEAVGRTSKMVGLVEHWVKALAGYDEDGKPYLRWPNGPSGNKKNRRWEK